MTSNSTSSSGDASYGALTPGNLSRSSSKGRSLSDVIPMLSPSPKFREPARASKDDISVPSNPTTPKRPAFPIRGLSLQMPSKEQGGLDVSTLLKSVPLSPKLALDASPGSVLPRRSRGFDFSRACTNLHHSTLAEQSSPDSSPTLAGRGVMIPPRKGLTGNGNMHESPSNASSLWSTLAQAERTGMSSSVGSTNMMDSDSSESTSDDDPMDGDDTEDTIVSTPQVYKMSSSSNPFASGAAASPGGDWMGNYSPAASSLMSFQRARLRGRPSRKSSSSASASGGSSMASPTPASPPIMKGIDTSSHKAHSRRTSLSWGTRDLRISSGADSDDGDLGRTSVRKSSSELGLTGTPGVVRRPVTRRGNLLPKTKNFARIKAALMEEGSPVESEFQREAEVVRQVRESDTDLDLLNPAADPSRSELPTVPGLPDSLENMNDDDLVAGEGSTGPTEKGLMETFSFQAKRHSGGKEFWEKFDERTRTPPPPLFSRSASVAVSEDMSMDSPLPASISSSAPNQQMVPHPTQHKSSASSRSSTPQPANHPSAAEITRRINNKRRRDEDFDGASFKRRAVSPGMSVQSSPILAQSPTQKDSGWWGVSKGSASASSNGNNQSQGERVNSGASSSSTSVNGTKRIGIQGMSDTSDNLLKMSIE